ncbi:MAG: glucose-1-phosphate adenylyltransferase subunit GlgD [Clostridiales bacterium]|jgi:glucose-1-phosphate adenylyltransferase|nr:glucose-1-phosphate adenylyltransferase subunit GlgD [Clostridiales bacterium]
MRAIGIILAGGNNDRLGQLTSSRATSAMPIASCYRTIDFPLSNMTNSGVTKVAVITQFNSRSLHDHLTSSKWWDFGRKQGGLFVFTPFLSNDNSFWFRGTADSIYQNISFLKRSKEPYVIIASGDCVYKMDYNKLLDHHIAKEADITIACKTLTGEDVRQYGVMDLNSEGRVIDFEEKPVEPTSSTISLGIYVISRTLLIKMLEAISAEGRYDFVKDIIIRYRKKIKIHAWEYNGYWKSINSTKSYFDTNMDFLKADVRYKFIKEYPYIATKPKDQSPVKYNHTAVTVDSLVGSGSILNGYVEHSVLFRRVVTGENSRITNCILLEGVFIGKNCVIENAIFDKEVILPDNKTIIGEPGKPIMITKNDAL